MNSFSLCCVVGCSDRSYLFRTWTLCLNFRSVCGCNSPLVVVRIVQYFGRLRVIFTMVFVEEKLLVLCVVAIDPLQRNVYRCSRSERPLKFKVMLLAYQTPRSWQV